MQDVIIVGITGLARSGKDTVAGILCRRFGFTRIGLADGVRSAFRDLDGPTWELTKGLEAAGKTSRWGLQQLGTEARKLAMCPNVWLDLLATKMTYLARIDPLRRGRFVIPDVRYPGEAGHLDSLADAMGGESKIWRVERPGAGLDGPEGDHSSEREAADILADLTITNDGPMEYLEALVSNFAEELIA